MSDDWRDWWIASVLGGGVGMGLAMWIVTSLDGEQPLLAFGLGAGLTALFIYLFSWVIRAWRVGW